MTSGFRVFRVQSSIVGHRVPRPSAQGAPQQFRARKNFLGLSRWGLRNRMEQAPARIQMPEDNKP